MEINHDEPLFISHLTMLLSLILPKKIDFANKYYRGIKENLSFLDITIYRRFGKRKIGLFSQRTQT